jgi:hypothetical protein
MDKLDDDTAELEQTITHVAKMMKYEREDGDNGIWMNEEDKNASNPLVDSNCFHADVEEWGHHEMNGVLEKKKANNAKATNCLK